MNRTNKSFLLTLISICFLSLLGSKDIGIFVKNFNMDNGQDVVNFSEEEKVEIIGQDKNMYIIGNKTFAYKVPKEFLLRINENENNYRVINDQTFMMDKPDLNSIALKELQKGDVLHLDSIDGQFGYFHDEGLVYGYIDLSLLEKVNEKVYLANGLSNVSKLVNNGKVYYVLSKGEPVMIKNYKDKQFVIKDEEENEFTVPSSYISLNSKKITSSRSLFSRRTSSVSKVVTNAFNAIGAPYVSGGTGEKGYDCSGFTYSVYKNSLGIKLPRTSKSQTDVGILVDKSQLMPGDLLFFNTSGKGISHVGLYIGEGKMIHASSGSMMVEIADINSIYYKSRFVTARRIVTN